jgi:predicted dehydrogenase
MIKTLIRSLQHNQIWVVGAGNMALEYAKILNYLEINHSVIVRNKNRAKNFKLLKNCKIILGDLNFALETLPPPKYSIVCTNVTNLFLATKTLLEKSVDNLLIEKPGLLSLEHLKIINKLISKTKSNVFYAFNRRYLPSVLELLRRTYENGELLALHTELSERWNLIPKEAKDKEELKKWGISNSIHMIDLIQLIAGDIKQITTYRNKGLLLHPSGSQFVFSGETVNNIMLSGVASWGSGGGWSIDAFSKNYKLSLNPIETLNLTDNKTFKKNLIIMSETETFKLGLKPMLEDFLNFNFGHLCSIEQLKKNIIFANKLFGY